MRFFWKPADWKVGQHCDEFDTMEGAMDAVRGWYGFGKLEFKRRFSHDEDTARVTLNGRPLGCICCFT